MNRTTFFLFFLILFLFPTLIRINKTFFIANKKKGIKMEGWTFFMALMGYYCVILLSIIEYYFLNHSFNYLLSLIGLIISFIGFYLTLSSINTLGPDWSLAIEIKQNGQMITGGVYKYIRHPYYVGVIFELLGISFFLNSYYALIFLLIFQIPILILRGILEEKVLNKQFGETYKNYRKETGAIIPRIK